MSKKLLPNILQTCITSKASSHLFMSSVRMHLKHINVCRCFN